VEVDVGAAHDPIAELVLHPDEALGELAHVVVVDEGDGRDGLLAAVPRVAGQLGADQVAQRLGAVVVAAAGEVPVERLEEGTLDGDAEADELAARALDGLGLGCFLRGHASLAFPRSVRSGAPPPRPGPWGTGAARPATPPSPTPASTTAGR